MLIKNYITDKARIIIKSGLLAFALIKGIDVIDKWHPPSEKTFEPSTLVFDDCITQFIVNNPDDFLRFDIENQIHINDVPEYSYNDILDFNLPQSLSNNSCGPTAVFDVFEYWAQNGYPNLSSDDKGAVFTYVSNSLNHKGNGLKPYKMLKPMEEYPKSKGYEFKSHYYSMFYWNKKILWEVICDEMKSQRPVIAGIPTYESGEIDHAVVITGIDEYYKTISKFTYTSDKYLRINDSYESQTPTYIDFNKLDDFCIITLTPEKD